MEKDKILQTECSYDGVVIDAGIIQMLDAIQLMLDRDIGDDYDEKFDNPRILHGIWGTETELGELTDAFKRSWFYHKPLDTVNLKEEIGDILWYVILLEDELNRTFYGTRSSLDQIAQLYDSNLEECYDKIVLKLKARYGESFDKGKAVERDLDTERTILES